MIKQINYINKKETSYKYVGEGAGDFQAVKIGGGRNWCPLIAAICAALLALALVMLLMTPAATTTTVMHIMTTHPPAPAPVPVPITLPPTPAPTPPPTTPAPPPPAPTPAPTPAPLNECEAPMGTLQRPAPDRVQHNPIFAFGVRGCFLCFTTG